MGKHEKYGLNYNDHEAYKRDMEDKKRLEDAAPELLEALKLAKGMLKNKGHYNTNDPLCGGAIEEAIKKAEG